MNTYVIAVMPWGFERTVQAESEKAAYKIVAESLSDAQRDNLECLDCIDVIEGA